MIRRYKVIIFILIGILLSMFLLNQARYQNAPLTQTFKLIDGQHITLANSLGKPVLLSFWSTTCSICIAEMPDLVNLYHRYHPKGFELISVTMPYDRPDRVIEMSKQHGLPFPVALDIFGDVALAFGGVNATPTHILINADGQIIDRFVGRIDPAKLGDTIAQQLNLRSE